MTEYFVGRSDELEAFKSCLRGTQNGVYFYGDGGIGKTQLVKRIIALSKDELHLPTSDLIDFFSTKNHSIEGVQNSIIKAINNPQAFQEILALRQQLQASQFKSVEQTALASGVTSSLQRRIEVLFAGCCNAAAQTHKLVLVCDSFEYVQEREVGRWFVRDFLPNLRTGENSGIVIVFAGRPKPVRADTPPNILKYPLRGLERDDLIDYMERIGILWGEDLEPLRIATGGNPLLIELIRWRGRNELLTDRAILAKLSGNVRVMANEIFDLVAMPTAINRVLWAMATLKRRFDFAMLQYLVDEMQWLSGEVNYNEIREELQTFPFVKSGEEDTSHLLHDEAIAPIAEVFADISGFTNLRATLFREIVHGYYPQQIAAVQDPNERAYLQAEQLGYILDQDWEAGMARYAQYRAELETQSNYDLEELLWGELQEHLAAHPLDKVLKLIFGRFDWLFAHGLHNKCEHLMRLFYQKFYQAPEITPTNQLEGVTSLGFALMRQGKLVEAQQYFQEALQTAQFNHLNDWMATIENNLGQLMETAGRPDQAIAHYWNSLKHYQRFESPPKIAAVYSARGAALASLGHYERALQHCTYALQILEDYPDAFRQTYAYRNIAFVYQCTGNYQTALTNLRKALGIAEREGLTELKTGVLQEMGQCFYRHGRQARQAEHNLTVDCSNQARALHAVLTALEQARKIDHRPLISQNLLQGAQIFEEIATLERLTLDKTELAANHYEFSPPLLETLITQVHNTQIPENIYWLQHGVEHFPNKDLADLTLPEKVVRLFELAALEALETNQMPLMVEGRIEAARILLTLGQKDEVKKIITYLKELAPEIYEDKALLAFGTLIQADLAFDQGDLDSAQARYLRAMPMLTTAQGHVLQLVQSRIEELFKRIRSINDVNLALQWCQRLQETWLDARVEQSFPWLLERLQMLAHELAQKMV